MLKFFWFGFVFLLSCAESKPSNISRPSGKLLGADTLQEKNLQSESSSSVYVDISGIKIECEPYFKLVSVDGMKANWDINLCEGMTHFEIEVDSKYKIKPKEYVTKKSFQYSYSFNSSGKRNVALKIWENEIEVKVLESVVDLVEKVEKVEKVGHAQTTQSSSEVNLNIPYEEQKTSSWCQITSLTMGLKVFGIETTQSALNAKYGYSFGQHPEGLASMAKSMGASKSTYTIKGSFNKIKEYLKEGSPVVVFGCFTNSGHVMLIKGYNEKGFIIHDPWGQWNGCVFNNSAAGCGAFPNDGCSSGYNLKKSGENVVYEYSKFLRAVSENGDGNIWMTVVRK